MLITFEGIDGCGKSSQVRLLHQKLQENGCEVICTREPGGTALAELIRTCLLDVEHKIDHTAELLLILAARMQHVQEVIVPALSTGQVVLCDRFMDSTIAYQGYGRGLHVQDLIQAVHCPVQAQLTFWLDLPVELALQRLTAKRDRFESEGLQFLKKVADGYGEIWKQNPTRIVRVDATQSIETIFQDIACRVHHALKQPYEGSNFAVKPRP